MKKVILLFSLLFQLGLSAQTVTIDFSYYPGKEVSICLKNGIVCDTIWTGMLDDTGKAVADLRSKADDYAGMATLNINVSPAVMLGMVINGKEDVHISSPAEYPQGENVIFSSSNENETLQKWFINQTVRQQKVNLLNEAEKLYKKEDDFFSSIVKERQNLGAEQSVFEKELTESKLYVAKFIQYQSFLSTRVNGLLSADPVGMATMRTYVRDSLDVNGLFTSGLWFPTINGLLALYDYSTPYHKDFITDMSLLLERAGSERIYYTLAENLLDICLFTGWNDMEEQLVNYLTNSGRIENPKGKLKTLMTMFKLGKGSKAPDLLQGRLSAGNILLVFYQTGCGPCEMEMQQLTKDYPLLKEKGYEVVSVSLDMDKQVFKDTADTFPWEAKYCDFQGIDGPDSENYGVRGTPTFFVIKDGVLEGRYVRLMDTGIIMNKNQDTE